MSEEMKLILEKLAGIDTINEKLNYMQADIGSMQADIGSIHNDISSMRADIVSMQADIGSIHNDISSMRADIISMQADIGSIHNDISTLQTKLTSVQFILENETNKKIDVIGEGHDFLKRNLSEALAMARDKERMDLDILNIKMDVRRLKELHEIA